MPLEPSSDTVRAAYRIATARAARAGVRIEPIVSMQQSDDAASILRTIWGGDPTALPGNAIRALAHAGNYTVTVHDDRDDGRLIGASVAFCCEPARSALHSHITGLLVSERDRDAGTAVKVHQRAWALERGLATVTWTFDPLIARNAHFNLVKLGAVAMHYLVDFYGEMLDAINAGDESDRLEVDWDLTAPWPHSAPPPPAASRVLEVGPDQLPVERVRSEHDEAVHVEVPSDIERLRRTSPELGRRWRHALRDAMTELLDDGYVIAGFSRHGYTFTREAP